MPSSTNRQLTERVDALEQQQAATAARLDAWTSAISQAFGYAGLPEPPGLRDEYRPVLSVIQGGQR